MEGNDRKITGFSVGTYSTAAESAFINVCVKNARKNTASKRVISLSTN